MHLHLEVLLDVLDSQMPTAVHRRTHPAVGGPAPGAGTTGSQSAFATIVREHQAMVFGLAFHFLRCRAEAEELAQDVFLALHQNLLRVSNRRGT